MNNMSVEVDGDVNVMNDSIVYKVRRVAKSNIRYASSKMHKGKYNSLWSREIKKQRQESKRLNRECKQWLNE